MLPQANGSAFISVFDSSASLYVGIKVSIADPINKSEGIIEVKLDSMKRKEKGRKQRSQEQEDPDTDSFNLKLGAQIIDEFVVRFIDKKLLLLKEGKKCLKLNIDVFLVDYMQLAYLELIVLGIRAAMENLEIPTIKITHNTITNEEQIELQEDKIMKVGSDLRLEMPTFFLIGEIEGNLVFDLTLLEYHSVDSVYVASVTKSGDILSLQKLGKGFIAPDSIFKLFATI